MHTLVAREGVAANHKRVHRVYREAGLQVRRRQRKRLARRERVPLPAPAEPRERWSMDFMADTLSDGRTFRTLNIVDDFTRECVAIEVDRSLPGARVVRVLERLRDGIGLPRIIVVDDGPEFAGRTLDAWAYANNIELRFIRPGKPIENAYVESFNGKCRDECLNEHWFVSLADAQAAIEAWRVDYNTVRPHSALQNQTPAAFAMASAGARRRCRLALNFLQPRTDSHCPCSGSGGQVRYNARASCVSPRAMFSAFWQDLVWAGRQFRRTPIASLFAVVTLALGISGTITAFGLVEYFHLKRLPVRQPNGLVVITGVDAKGQAAPLTLQFVTELSRAEIGIERVAGYLRNGSLTVRIQQRLLRASVAAVTSEYYATLGLRPILGRFPAARGVGSTSDDRPQAVVVSYAFWTQQLASDRYVIGKTLDIEGVHFEILGVMPREFTGLEVGAPTDVTVPLASVSRVLNLPPNWPVPVTHAVGRLVRGSSLESVRPRLTTLWPSLLEAGAPTVFPPKQRDHFLTIRPVVDSAASGFSFVRDRYSRPLFSLLGLSVVMLLVTAGNIAALLLARAAARLREFSVRVALGAPRVRLYRLLLIEAGALSALGAGLGLPLAAWGHYVVSRSIMLATTPNASPIGLLQVPNLRLAFCVVVVTTLIAGIVPAWLLSRTSSWALLQSFRVSAQQPNRWGGRVLVAQVAGAVVLLATSAFFVRTLLDLRNDAHGFRADGVILARLAPQPGGYSTLQDAVYYRQLVNDLAQVPGVAGVALSKSTPASGRDAAITQLAAPASVQDDSGAVSAALEVVSPRFFEVMGMRLLVGRDFYWTDDLGSTPVAVLSQSLADALFPNKDPVGAHVRYGVEPRYQELSVIGVVSDASLGGLYGRAQPTVYVNWLQQPPPYARWPTVAIWCSLPLPAIAADIHGIVDRLGHEYVEDLRSLQQQIERSTAREALLATVAAFFGALATVLVCLGLVAALLQTVSRQRREIGVRLAIGAPTRRVRATVFRRSIAVSLAGILCGLPLAVVALSFAQRALPSARSYGLEPAFIAAVVLLVAAALAAYIPARRAAQVSPAEALRGE